MYVSRKQLERLGETLGDISTPSKFNRKYHGGGGKGGDMPDAPDYLALAKQQAADQSNLLRQQTQANRVDQYGPLGSVTFSQGGGQPTFDQAGYDAAYRNYQNALNNYNSASSTRQPTYGGLANYGTLGTGNVMRGTAPSAPNRNDFMTSNQDKWSQTTTLSPEMQAILNQNLAAKGQSYDQLQKALGNINNNNLPLASVNAGETAQDAILRRVNPQLVQQEDQLRTRLVNQGVRPGSEAWDREMNLFNQQKNDAVSQAALQGINVGNDARARALAEQGIPINLINAYQSGGQAEMPQFTNYAQQGVAQSPDLLGAGQAQYNSALQGYNANQASNSNMMGGLFGLGSSLLGAPSGGFLGSILGF